MALSTILLLCFISEASMQYILVERERWPMSEAFMRCREDGGSLITIEHLQQYTDAIKNQCQTPNILYWIGNYSTMTPFLSLEGCFAYKELNTTLFEIDNNSVAKCEARCKTDDGIAVMDNVCQCVKYNSDGKETFEPVDVSRCNIHRKEEILGGNESAMSVYLRSKGAYSTDGINPYCLYGKCDGRRYFTFFPCSSGNEAKTVCMTKGLNSARLVTTSAWWKTMEECMQTYGSYTLTLEQFMNNVNSLCVKNDSTLTWTNQREYRDSIIIPDTGIRERFIYSSSIVCTMANLVDLKTSESTDCNTFKEHNGYICLVESARMKNVSRQNSTCIVDIELQTTEKYTTNSDLITSDQDIPESKLSQGLIIGIVMAIVVLIIIGIGVTVRMRASKLRKYDKDCPQNGEVYNISQEPKRSQGRGTYEELEGNDTLQNLNVYQHLKGNDVDKAKTYEDLQNYENTDAYHVYEKCKDGSTEEIKGNYANCERVEGCLQSIDDEGYELSSTKVKNSEI